MYCFEGEVKGELDDIKETTGKTERIANETKRQIVETEKKVDEIKDKMDELLVKQEIEGMLPSFSLFKTILDF